MVVFQYQHDCRTNERQVAFTFSHGAPINSSIDEHSKLQ